LKAGIRLMGIHLVFPSSDAGVLAISTPAGSAADGARVVKPVWLAPASA
jgi:hypothetical protein